MDAIKRKEKDEGSARWINTRTRRVVGKETDNYELFKISRLDINYLEGLANVR